VTPADPFGQVAGRPWERLSGVEQTAVRPSLTRVLAVRSDALSGRPLPLRL